jgi:predicted nucleic acid-binding protein
LSDIIVADAGPLIALGRINQIESLTALFGRIIIPQAVYREITYNANKADVKVISLAIKNKQIEIASADIETDKLLEFLSILDEGEAAAIYLAKERNLPLLIDEKLGRGIAQKANITIIGTAGVLLLAKKKGVIPAVAPLINY